ncbi:hypothetical protein CYE34_004440 [Salmonella enterica subsp. enterica serovar Oranienburg]|nr:hypothetical protein [Salmonella enterica subsp. enterica serovar Oranienburg]
MCDPEIAAAPYHYTKLSSPFSVNAKIIGRFGGADVFLDGFIAQCRVADGTFLG